MEQDTTPILTELCNHVEGSPRALPVYRTAGAALDARSLVARSRKLAALAGDLSGQSALVLGERPESVLTGFLAVALAGGLPLIVNPGRTGESDASRQERVRHAARSVSARCACIEGEWRPVSGAISGPSTTSPADTAYFQLSSGSCGPPRPLRIPHAALRLQLDLLASAFGVGPGDTVGTWLPLSHDMGLIIGALLALHRGCPLLLWSPEEFMAAPRSWVSSMAEAGVTYFPVVPAGMHVTTKALIAGSPAPPLRVVPVAADVIRAPVLSAFEEALPGAPDDVIRPCYGMADATLMVTCAPVGHRWRTVPLPPGTRTDRTAAPPESTAMVSVGNPVPPHEVWVEKDGGAVGEGVIGHIIVRTPTRCSGPYGSAHVSADVPIETGDLGFLAEGELVFTGRAREVIRVAGEDFLPTEIEDFVVSEGLAKHGRVAAVGVTESSMTRIAVVVEDEQAGAQERRHLLRAARRRGIPLSEVRFVERDWLPKTTSGKLQRVRIAALLSEPKEE